MSCCNYTKAALLQRTLTESGGVHRMTLVSTQGWKENRVLHFCPWCGNPLRVDGELEVGPAGGEG